MRVRFKFASGANARDPEARHDYFRELEPHLQAAAKSMHAILPRDGETMPSLLIEHFGTRV